MKVEPKKIRKKDHLTVCLSRVQAEIFLDMFGRDERFSDISKDLDEGLKPVMVYEVECSDCPRKFEVEVTERLEKKDLKDGGICVHCSDDYK